MIPKSLPLEEFLRDPDAGRARLGDGDVSLVVLSAQEYEVLLHDLEEARFITSVRAGFESLDRGEGIALEELEAQFEAEDAEAERAA